MTLTDHIRNTLSTRADNLAEQLHHLNRIKTQTEVFSDELISARLFTPAQEILTRFQEAFAHLGEVTYEDQSSMLYQWVIDPCLEITRRFTLPAGDKEEIFNAFLSIADENTWLTASAINYSTHFRVGAIQLAIYVQADTPTIYLNLLRDMGVLRTEHETQSYDSISCSFL